MNITKLAIPVVMALLLCSCSSSPSVSSTSSEAVSDEESTAISTDAGTTGSANSDSSSADTATVGDTAQTTANQDTSIITTTTEGSASSVPDNDNNNSGYLDASKYTLEAYTLPYWEGNVVYNESVYPLENQSGSVDPVSLLYKADSIIEVRSSDLQTLYTEGTDYRLENGQLIIPEGSSIPTQDYDGYYLSEAITDHSFERVGGGYLYFSEGSTFHSRQIAVTYTHSAGWTGPVPAKKGAELPNLMSKLENKESVKIVYCGDSITQGANSSGAIGTQPGAPKWVDMFTDALTTDYGVEVAPYNSSEGGQVSNWALTNVSGKIIRFSPDLLVLAFGMNDGTVYNNVSAATFQSNIKQVIDKVHAQLPNCDIILVSSILPNAEVKGFFGKQLEYPAKLQELADQYDGVAFANVTEMYQVFLANKRYCDITGNNVNHPNDFTARLYTQVLLQTIKK